MIALIIGATGATGKSLVMQLLENPAITKIIQFVRKNIDLKHEKIETHIVDFEQIGDWKNLIKGDMAFSVLGTTLKDAGSKEEQYKVDFTYQYEFAKAAKENNIKQYVLLSAMGADTNSSVFYSRIKGELDAAVQALNFERLAIFRPGVLVRENSNRKGENFAINFINIINKLGLMTKYKPLPTKALAQAMINQCFKQKEPLEIITLDEILKLV